MCNVLPTLASESTSSTPSLSVGDPVRLLQNPPYLKTADAMPMLRPPDLVDSTEVGLVVGLRAMEQVAVRFRRGTFLLEMRLLEKLTEA